MPTTWPVPNADDIRSSIAHYKGVDGSVLSALQVIQEKFGYVPDIALDATADICNVSRAEVYGVFTYYSDFRTCQPASNVIKVCLAEACQATGSAELVDAIKNELGLDVHARTRTDEVEVSPVFCLGNCALGPSVSVNEHLLGRTTVARIRSAMEGMA